MKKVFSVVLALVMVLSLSLTAFADIPVNNGSQTVDAEYVAGTVTDTGTVYSVHLEWTSFNDLTYTQGDTVYRWDAATSKYVVDEDKSTDDVWSGGSFSVTVTNKSNADITATASYADNAGDSLSTVMDWTKQSVTCESAARNISGYTGTGAPTTGVISGTVTVTSGSISADTAGVGTISITIN